MTLLRPENSHQFFSNATLLAQISAQKVAQGPTALWRCAWPNLAAPINYEWLPLKFAFLAHSCCFPLLPWPALDLGPFMLCILHIIKLKAIQPL